MSLDANFANGPEGAALRAEYGRDAPQIRDLLVQMICYCKLAESDGFVPESEIAILGHPLPSAVTMRNVARLEAVGFITKAVRGYVVPGYLRDNRPRAISESQASGQSEGARRANHERWHRKRQVIVPECEFCQFTDRSTDQYSDQSTDRFSDQYSDEFTDAETDQSTDQVSDQADSGGMAELFNTPGPPTGDHPPAGCEKHPRRRHGNCRGCGTSGRDRGSDEPDSPEFTEFWSVYPIKVGKPRARLAWKAAMKRGHDPALIITAAKAYREEPGRTRQYTAHASSWLNDERYVTDPDEDAPDVPDGTDYDWEA